jgi:hypothetical protein
VGIGELTEETEDEETTGATGAAGAEAREKEEEGTGMSKCTLPRKNPRRAFRFSFRPCMMDSSSVSV